jgi:hypothetical protein
MKLLKWCKERFICFLGFHGFSNKEDVSNKKCSFCGKHFEGYLKEWNIIP